MSGRIVHLLSLVMITTFFFSIVTTSQALDCKKSPFHPTCRGVSSKRFYNMPSMPNYVLDTDNKPDSLEDLLYAAPQPQQQQLSPVRGRLVPAWSPIAAHQVLYDTYVSNKKPSDAAYDY